jgi:hypothetical protein
MTSRQGHKRYWTRKKLTNLVGKSIVLTHLNDEGCYAIGHLSRQTDLTFNNQNGFYFEDGIECESITTIKLPVNGIVDVGAELTFDDSYLSVKGKAHLVFNDTYRGALR